MEYHDSFSTNNLVNLQHVHRRYQDCKSYVGSQSFRVRKISSAQQNRCPESFCNDPESFCKRVNICSKTYLDNPKAVRTHRQQNPAVRDTKSGRYDRYIYAAILSKAVLIFGPRTDRNRNCEHYAVGSVLLTLWSKHRSDSRALLTTIYQHNNLIILHNKLNLVID